MEAADDFEHIIAEDHPYSQLIGTVKLQLKDAFAVHPTDHQSFPQTAFPLRMYCRQSEHSKVPNFVYFFTFPVSLTEYLALVRDFPLQKQLDPNIDEYCLHEPSQQPDTELVFLSYKKVFIVMPRFFIYVRYCFTLMGEIWLVGIEHPSEVNMKDKTRGKVVLSVTRVREVEGGCEVSVATQVDMSMNIKFDMAMNRGFTGIRKYLQRFHGRITKQK